MKILWLCNVVIPQVCNKINVEQSTGGGWMTQLADFLDASDEVELSICAAISTEDDYLKIEWGNDSVFMGLESIEILLIYMCKNVKKSLRGLLKKSIQT
ncbi:hypothetical protein CIY_27320 [Butyrivibrio fibrisolvens 16/4]|nr:hypothetical protein CIY_27320 [Butyrivibrio fibrisolvens 16/4]